MNAPGAARERRRAEVAHRLFDVLPDLLSTGTTYESVSVARLAAAAGLSRASFYLYFAGKSDLVLAALEGAERAIASAAAAWLRLGPSSTLDDFEAAVKDLMTGYLSGEGAMRAVAHERTRNREFAAEAERLLEALGESFANQISRAQLDGWMSADLDPQATALWAVSALDRRLGMMLDAGDRRVEAAARSLADLAWHVLRNDAVRPSS